MYTIYKFILNMDSSNSKWKLHKEPEPLKVILVPKVGTQFCSSSLTETIRVFYIFQRIVFTN